MPPLGTPISVMGLCFKIWDTGAIRDRPGRQSPTQNYTRGHSTFSGTEAMGGVMGSALAKCGSNPQASKLIKSSLLLGVLRGCWWNRWHAGRRWRRLWLKSSRPHTPLTARTQAGLRGVFCPNSSPFFPQLDRLLQCPGAWSPAAPTLVLLGPRAPRRMELVGGRARRREEAGVAGAEKPPVGLAGRFQHSRQSFRLLEAGSPGSQVGEGERSVREPCASLRAPPPRASATCQRALGAPARHLRFL